MHKLDLCDCQAKQLGWHSLYNTPVKAYKTPYINIVSIGLEL